MIFYPFCGDFSPCFSPKIPLLLRQKAGQVENPYQTTDKIRRNYYEESSCINPGRHNGVGNGCLQCFQRKQPWNPVLFIFKDF